MQEKTQIQSELNDFLISRGYLATPFTQNSAGLLLINVSVNDIPGLFILDTGAGSTVIDASQSDRLNLVLQTDSRSFDGGGAGGVGLEVIPSTGNTIQIGDHIFPDFTLAIMSLEHAREALAQIGAAEDFVGILGVDVLKPAKAIIDYNTMTLYLYSGQ